MRLLGSEHGRVAEPGGSGLNEKVAHAMGVRQGSIGPPNPHGVGADDDRNRLTTAGDGHFLAGKHPIKDFR